MRKIFIINGGQQYENEGGEFNHTLVAWGKEYFDQIGAEVRVSNSAEKYDAKEAAENMMWADLVIYHIPVWWFQVPYNMKQYMDEVMEAGRKQLYRNDGRSRTVEPKLHYGTGGLMNGTPYFITTSWNAPEESFSVEGEFFHGMTADDVFVGVHKMNEFMGMKRLEGMHFFDMQKDIDDEKFKRLKKEYIAYLAQIGK